MKGKIVGDKKCVLDLRRQEARTALGEEMLHEQSEKN